MFNDVGVLGGNVFWNQFDVVGGLYGYNASIRKRGSKQT